MNRRRTFLLAGLSTALLAFSHLLAPLCEAGPKKSRSSLSREVGAMYIEDLVEKPVKVKVTQLTPVYTQLKGGRAVGNFMPGRQVEVIALSDRAVRVRGRATHGRVSGWIAKKHVKAEDKDFFTKMTKLHERHERIEKSISKKQVVLGMTPDEVKRAMGRPNEKSSRITKEGRIESFAYLTFQRVPQTQLKRDVFGRIYRTTVYVKVETGRILVDFENGLVSGIEESESQPVDERGKLVPPPPIEVF